MWRLIGEAGEVKDTPYSRDVGLQNNVKGVSTTASSLEMSV
jgi:hypothetical protein